MVEDDPKHARGWSKMVTDTLGDVRRRSGMVEDGGGRSKMVGIVEDR
jgi:hypothetical protein